MKIVSVEPIPVAYPEPNDFDATRYLCLVKVCLLYTSDAADEL